MVVAGMAAVVDMVAAATVEDMAAATAVADMVAAVTEVVVDIEAA
jgi:hypothetical protein